MSKLRFTSALAAVLLLSACSTTKTGDQDSVSSDAAMGTGDRAPITSVENTDAFGPTPGTQQDLVVNIGDRIFFDYDQFDLRQPAREVIERQVQWLQQYPQLKIIVEGHCDERGTREYNLALGDKRGASVRNYMIALGLDANRIETISYGKERPAVTGSNTESWAQNRRSVTVVE